MKQENPCYYLNLQTYLILGDNQMGHKRNGNGEAGATAIVKILDTRTSESYSLFLPKHGVPCNVATLLRNAFPTGHSPRHFEAGQVVASLIGMLDTKQVVPKLVPNEFGEADLVVALSYGSRFLLVQAFGAKALLFTGTLSEFLVWADGKKDNLTTTVGRTVQFTYNGWSQPGLRTVIVQGVKAGKDGNMLIEAIDTAKLLIRNHEGKLTIEDGYRQYCSEKIVGGIKIVN